MNRYVIAATALGAVLATPVLADETTGTITSINQKTDAITLSDGKTYILPEGIEAEELKAGEKVHVTFAPKGGKLLASKISSIK
jgi:hypothetical protein